jgi:hypothetical protein
VEVWDSQSNTTTLASGNSSNAIPATSLCYWPSMDSSGRYVTFLANASNLTPTSPSSGYGIFLRDMQAGTTTWVDANNNTPSSPDVVMTFPRISAAGSSVAFESLGEGLVANDGNHVYNVFVYNASSGAIELISSALPALASTASDGASQLSASCISTNGRYVAFASEADNLVPNDTNGYRDIFVRDILAGSNYLASVNTNGNGSGNGISYQPALSGNGRFVAFTSSASNLYVNDTNSATDVFLRDLASNTTTLVSVNTNGNGPGSGASFSPLLSVDGRYVTFVSASINLVKSALGPSDNLYWRDTQGGATIALTSLSASGTTNYSVAMNPSGQYVAYSGVSSPSTVYLWSAQSAKNIYTNSATSAGGAIAISPSGTRLGFYGSTQPWAVDSSTHTTTALGTSPYPSHATMQFSADSQYLVYTAKPSGYSNQIYLYSFTSGSNILVSSNYNGTGAANNTSDSPAISGDGLYIAYRSLASNIVPGVTNGLPNIYLYNCATASTTLLNSDIYGYGAANNRSMSPVFSGAGETLVFESWASDIAGGDYNEWGNLYAFQPFSMSATNANGGFSIQNTGYTALDWPLGNQPAPVAPSFTWLTTPGTVYQAQFTDDLSDPNWQPLINNVSIVGGEGYAVDTAPNSPNRFYRVAAIP